MYNFYDSGILMARFGQTQIEIRNPYQNTFLQIENHVADQVFSDNYIMDPRPFLEDWDRMQALMNNAVKASESYFITADGRYYEENGETWIQRETMKPVDILTKNQKIIGFIKVDRSSCCILVMEGHETFTPLMKYQSLSKDLFGVISYEDKMVKMRDGIHLSTKVLLPKGLDRVPVILCRTPYGKESMVQTCLHYVQRGFGVVIQDTRGREASEGEWIPMLSESEDGDDTLTWIGESEFCNGSVGMIGSSYGGYVQWAAAVSGNPYLKTMISIVTAGSPFKDIPYRGGCLMSGTLAWAFAMAERKLVSENMKRDDWDELLKVRPTSKIVEAGLGKEVPFWKLWCEEDVYNAFWHKQNWWAHRQNMNDIPVFILSGWYDDNSMGTTEAIDLINERHFSNYQILLGPWLHKGNETREINGIFLGKDAIRYDVNFECLNWFEKHLKSSAFEQEHHVEYYDVGKQIWETASSWPPSSNKLTLSLRNELQAEGEYTSFTYDPRDPAPHIIDLSTNEATPPGDYKEIEKRSDVLTFTSAVLYEDLTIAGDIIVNFYASSDCTDTDWVVRIMDVDQLDRSIKIAENPLRAKFRNGFDKPDYLIPNEIYPYQIRTTKIATTFRKGHRIRLMITSSASGIIFENTNTGTNPSLDTTFAIAHQKIFHSEQYNSCIILPVV